MTVDFIVLNEMLAGIVPSQVIAPARCHAAALPEVSFRVVFLEPARVALSARARRRLAELRALWPGGRIVLWPYVGRLGRFAPSWSLRAASRVRHRPAGASIFHCRGPEATIQARAAGAGRARVVFDARGATDHENALRLSLEARPDPRLIRRVVKLCIAREREALVAADAVSAIGESLADRYRGWLGSDRKPVAVVPCCVDRPLFSPSARAVTRQHLGLADDDLLLLHTSTVARWEAFAEVIAFFRVLRRSRRARLLFVTPLAAEVVTASIPQHDPLHADVAVVRVDPQEIPAYLSAGDVGMLVRARHEAFAVGNPVKFSEYLGAGLAIVASPGIGTTAEVVEGCAVGVVLADERDPRAVEAAAARLLDLLRRDHPDVRRRAIAACQEQFVWSRYTDRVASLYGFATTVGCPSVGVLAASSAAGRLVAPPPSGGQ